MAIPGGGLVAEECSVNKSQGENKTLADNIGSPR